MLFEPAAPRWRRPQASVEFIGDSFTSGTRDGGLGPAKWTALRAAQNVWAVTDAAVDGAGYVESSPQGRPFSAQVSAVGAARPSLVVVVGARRT